MSKRARKSRSETRIDPIFQSLRGLSFTWCRNVFWCNSLSISTWSAQYGTDRGQKIFRWKILFSSSELVGGEIFIEVAGSSDNFRQCSDNPEGRIGGFFKRGVVCWNKRRFSRDLFRIKVIPNIIWSEKFAHYFDFTHDALEEPRDALDLRPFFTHFQFPIRDPGVPGVSSYFFNSFAFTLSCWNVGVYGLYSTDRQLYLVYRLDINRRLPHLLLFIAFATHLPADNCIAKIYRHFHAIFGNWKQQNSW